MATKLNQIQQAIKQSIQQAKVLPVEATMRSSYSFGNLIIEFPTHKGKNATPVVLPAYIKSIEDTFNSTFNSEPVYGRMDEIPVYARTTRTIRISVGLPAFNEINSEYNLVQINRIIQNLYPSYRQDRDFIISSPPLLRIKFGNLIKSAQNKSIGLLGYINGSFSVNHAIEEEGVFVITEKQEQFIVPKAYDLTFSFTVLHEKELGWNKDKFTVDQFPYAIRRNLPFNASQSKNGTKASKNPLSKESKAKTDVTKRRQKN
tara:strand:+ start:235 stop:1014 length:780 start_codon:yes stop_codon:yes gene_type:complete